MQLNSTRMNAAQLVFLTLRNVMFLLLLLAALGTFLPARADGFHLELAYCDVQAGPLTVAPDSDVPLPDGCYGQVIEHLTSGDIPRPDADGNPGGDDRTLTVSSAGEARRAQLYFSTNGLERLQAAGFFMIDPVLQGSTLPDHPVYVRVWNAANPAQATYYYETPLYAVVAGSQQMNFSRDQLTNYPAAGTMDSTPPAMPAEFNVLSSYPNPFNAQSTLTYSLAQPAHVAINLYDVQGRRAVELVDGNVTEGVHAAKFDASNLPTGAYFAVLNVNGANVSTRRMTLLK